jgi:hypothetical protein
MTDTVNIASIRIGTAASISTNPDIGSSTYSFSTNDSNTFTNGTGNNQVNQVFTDTRTISASSSENLDLAGGLVSALNTTLTFTKIKMIEISAATANTNNVLVGGHAAGLSTMFVLGGDAAIEDVQIVIPPGGLFVLTAPAAGFTVTASTADILQIANSSSGTSVTYTIKIYGCV